MTLKSVLDTTEGLSEEIKKLYVQKDDKFFLDVSGADSLPEIANLKSAYERVKIDKSKLKEDLEAAKARIAQIPDDFSADAWKALKENNVDSSKLISIRTELEGKVTKAEARAADLEAKLLRISIERDLEGALAAANITDAALMKGASALLSPSLKVGSDGKVFAETDLGPVGVADFVKKWVAGDGKAFVTAPKGSGSKGNDGGNGNGGDVNPWDPKTRNMTAQGTIIRSDPEKARSMMAAAGIAKEQINNILGSK